LDGAGKLFHPALLPGNEMASQQGLRMVVTRGNSSYV
jgi:hypothetical protein